MHTLVPKKIPDSMLFSPKHYVLDITHKVVAHFLRFLYLANFCLIVTTRMTEL